MTRDDIIRMAREAGLDEAVEADVGDFKWILRRDIERFAHLVAASEREACAVICLAESEKFGQGTGERRTLRLCAATIRARGEK